MNVNVKMKMNMSTSGTTHQPGNLYALLTAHKETVFPRELFSDLTARAIALSVAFLLCMFGGTS